MPPISSLVLALFRRHLALTLNVKSDGGPQGHFDGRARPGQHLTLEGVVLAQPDSRDAQVEAAGVRVGQHPAARADRLHGGVRITLKGAERKRSR